MNENVLVVDDDTTVLRTVERILRRGGYEVTCFDRGSQAINAIREKQYELAIVDVRMPTLSGPEVLNGIRSLEREWHRPRMPVIVLSGWTDDEEEDVLMGMGADDLILKPFEIKDFLAAIERNIVTSQLHGGERQMLQ